MSNRFYLHTGEVPSNHFESLVAMAVYAGDRAQWLNAAIQSITNQTYKNFVFVIVLDGPITDLLMNVVATAAKADNRIIVIKSQRNVGLAACMNFVIDWSLNLAPKYFFRMDADDVSHLDRLERQVSYLRAHQHVAVLGSGLTEVNEDGNKVGARVMPASHKQIIKMLPRRCTLNHPTVAIRYQVFEKGFRYDAHLKNTQDYFLWIELAKEGFVFRNLKDKLLDFRRVNDFYKRRGLSKSINEFKARFFAMWALKKMSPLNMVYALAVLLLRMMPPQMVKLAYKLDRLLLEKFLRH